MMHRLTRCCAAWRASPSLTRLRRAKQDRSFTLALALGLPTPGTLALIYGDQVSAALSIIVAGVVSRVIGTAFLTGAVLILIGLARGRHMTEIIGLGVTAAGFAIYSLGVLLGLGLKGALAGPIAVIIAVGIWWRIQALITTAAELRKIRDGDEP